MDPVKAAFLQAIMNQGKDIRQDNILPFLLAMQKNANERGITFSKQETDIIYDQMKEKLSPSDRQQLEMLRMMMQQNAPQNFNQANQKNPNDSNNTNNSGHSKYRK